jgi:hypothetical protein
VIVIIVTLFHCPTELIGVKDQRETKVTSGDLHLLPHFFVGLSKVTGTRGRVDSLLLAVVSVILLVLVLVLTLW